MPETPLETPVFTPEEMKALILELLQTRQRHGQVGATEDEIVWWLELHAQRDHFQACLNMLGRGELTITGQGDDAQVSLAPRPL